MNLDPSKLPPPAPVPDLVKEMTDGYLAACERWEADPEIEKAMLDPEHREILTIRPNRLFRMG